MPQPRRSQPPANGAAATQPPPPPGQGLSAGQVAGAAALAALVAGNGRTLPDLPGVTDATRAATATLLEAVDGLFRRRRGQLVTYVRNVIEQEMPDAPASRVEELARQEVQRELEFQRKARARLAADLPRALGNADQRVREAEVRQIMDREKRYLGQRESAAASRVVAALEHDLLKGLSPEGAYWQLSPLVREHTLGCLAMGGKVWPWPVLDEVHPQLHAGCQCRLLGVQEAIDAGLMTRDELPDPSDAAARAQSIAAEVRRLEESMAPEELSAVIADLERVRIMEARERRAMRWAAGTVKGGEFRPTRGGDPGKTVVTKLAHQLSLGDIAGRRDAGAGRSVHLRGQERFIPEQQHWDERIGGVRYTSPAGGTNVYRDGVLIGKDHPDLMEPGGLHPPAPPSKVEQPNATAANTPDPPLDGSDRPTIAAPTPVEGIPDYTGTELTLGKRAGGSQGAMFAFDKAGSRWLVKDYRGNQDRIATELLSNAIYREMGAPAANAGTYELHGEPDFSKVPDVKIADEPPLPKLEKGRRMSTGVIVREPDGSMWVYEPKGHFGGYEHTFPKGGLEKGLSPQQNALKELWEETGLHAAIDGFVGDFKGDTGTSRYYVASRTGGTPHPPDVTPYTPGGSETAAVKRLTPEEARQALNKPRDQAILDAVLSMPVPEAGKPDTFPEPVKGPALAYPTVPGDVREWKGGKQEWGPSRRLGEHYMTDALVANWDVAGLTKDNVLWQADPEHPTGEDRPVRLDQGGTLQFRAQGQPKPFGPVPTEVWSMRSPKGQAFDTMQVSEADMRDQARAIGDTLTDGKIDQLVDQAPFADSAMRQEVRDALKARVQWMRDFADGEQQLPQPLEGAAARRALTADQRDFQVFPEEHAALDDFARGGWKDVNAHLRSGADKSKTTPEVREMVKQLDGLTSAAKLADDVHAYVAYDPAKLGDPQQLVGRTLSDKGFATAVLGRGALSGAPGVIRLTLPAGSHAVYAQGVEGLDDLPRSVEMVLARGGRWRVQMVSYENGRPIVTAVLLP